MPEHAIRTLERLHHIFEKVSPSVTIISINEAQLKNTVVKMFGDKIPFEAYLRKFVDFRIELSSGNVDTAELFNRLDSYLNLLGREGTVQLQIDVITNLCDSMTARNFEKVCNNALLCHNLVGIDTDTFSKDFALVGLLLFACKIAYEQESNRGNILPIWGTNHQQSWVNI